MGGNAYVPPPPPPVAAHPLSPCGDIRKGRACALPSPSSQARETFSLSHNPYSTPFTDVVPTCSMSTRN